jgi:hypothetical protein
MLIKIYQLDLEAKNTFLNLDLRQEISSLRGKACKQVIKAASINDAWSMKRYSAINSYMADLDGSSV